MKNRSNSISFDDSSPSAILNISAVQCKDDGQYRCFVEYINSNGIGIKIYGYTAVHIQVMAEIPEFSIKPAKTTLKENTAVNLSCSANVGRPGGMVTIWKQSISSDVQFQLGNSSSSVIIDNGNCSAYANLLITYNLKRTDHGFIFGCTSKNRLTPESAPSTDVGPRSILYGPSNISIELSPQKHSFHVGDRIRLTCSSDGNPRPTFQWTLNFTEIIDSEKYHLSDQNTTLEFFADSITDNGYYHCFASNSFNGNLYNTMIN
uniref:Cell adhesion molecule 3-like n=1 Tax=Crassostrea virginica TaxID=6565 RepID=A0A8B8DA30_CRAVI|nr:cell adhesion molecule 3-like [Crassostrea virginica]